MAMTLGDKLLMEAEDSSMWGRIVREKILAEDWEGLNEFIKKVRYGVKNRYGKTKTTVFELFSLRKEDKISFETFKTVLKYLYANGHFKEGHQKYAIMYWTFVKDGPDVTQEIEFLEGFPKSFEEVNIERASSARFSKAQITASLRMAQGNRQKAAALLLQSSTFASAPLEERYDRDADARWYIANELRNPDLFDQDMLAQALDEIGYIAPDEDPFEKLHEWEDKHWRDAYVLGKYQDKTGMSWYAFEAKYGDEMREIADSPEAENFGKWSLIRQRLIWKLMRRAFP